MIHEAPQGFVAPRRSRCRIGTQLRKARSAGTPSTRPGGQKAPPHIASMLLRWRGHRVPASGAIAPVVCTAHSPYCLAQGEPVATRCELGALETAFAGKAATALRLRKLDSVGRQACGPSGGSRANDALGDVGTGSARRPARLTSCAQSSHPRSPAARRWQGRPSHEPYLAVSASDPAGPLLLPRPRVRSGVAGPFGRARRPPRWRRRPGSPGW